VDLRLGTLKIDRRFRGPPKSGNGGYVSGRLAGFIEGPARVRLSVPPPLEVELRVDAFENGVQLLAGDDIVATAWPTRVDIEAPPPPTYAEAISAGERFPGFDQHWYPGCFVCGPKREPGDGLRIFPGALAGRDLFACPWVPDASLAAEGQRVSPEFIWSALDCPGGFAFPPPAEGAILLGELSASLSGGVGVGEECVITAWEIAHEGRKHRTGTALFAADGRCRGVALATWIEVQI